MDDSSAHHDDSPSIGEVPQLSYIETLVNAVGGVAWEFDCATGAFTYVSDPAVSLLGYSREEWLEPGFWISRLHPEDKEWATKYCIAATGDGKDHEFDYRLIHADGSIVWVRDIVSVDAERRLEGHLRGILIDISARKRSEERLVGAEQHFQSIIDAVGLLAVEFDVSGRVTWANTHAETLFGLSPALIGRSLADLVSPGSRERTMEEFRRFVRFTDAPINTADVPVVDAGGEVRLIRSNYNRIVGPNGELVGIGSVSQDVTLKAAHEQQLALKSEEFDSIFALTHDRYFRLDELGRLTDFHMPYPDESIPVPDAWLGRPWADAMPESTARLLRSGIAAARESGEMASAEYEVPYTEAYAEREARFLPLEDGGTAVITRDITDRKSAERELRAAEQRYRAVLDSTPFGMHFLRLEDDRLIFHSANPAADVVLGIAHSPREGMTLDKAFPTLSELVLFTQLAEIARDGGLLGPFEFEFTQGDELRALEVTAFQTQPGVVASVFSDITERRAAIHREREYQQRLSALAADLTLAEDAERRRLAQELHDRVGQSLAAAMIHLRAAQSEEKSDSGALQLTRELLGQAIAETRSITTELFPPVLHDLGLAKAIRWLCDETERVHGLACVTELRGDFGSFDAQTETVLFRGARELLVNVAKHAHAQRAVVSLCGDDGFVELTVEDDGIGFDPDDPASGHPTAFGLFSIRDRLPHLGGELVVDSSIDCGTKVTMRLPHERRA